MNLSKNLAEWGISGTAVSVITVLMWLSGAWQPLEHLGYNLLFQLRHRLLLGDWEQRIAIIAIDEKSLAAYGRFADWNRDRYVQLLQTLAPAPPAAIGFDILFSEPSEDDQAFAQAIEFHGTVVLAIGVDATGQGIPVVPQLAEKAWLGHIAAGSDADGITRQIPLYAKAFPSFSVAVLHTYQEALSHTFSADKKARIQPKLRLPEPKSGQSDQIAWINWPGPAEKLSTYSFVDVVQEKVDPSVFLNKIVLVGVSAVGLDPLRTPFNQNPPTAGIYLQAAAIDNLLRERLLQRFPDRLIPLLLLILAFVTTWLLYHQSWQGRLMGTGGLLLAWWIIAFWQFSFFQRWLPTAAPLGTIFLATVATQLREQYEKQQLMNLFAQHVAPEMAQIIWQRKAEILLDGQLKPQELTATILFADLRGFTSVSENLAPGELLIWLNLYLETMSQCLMEHGGIIDKYIGDAIMAVFGVPFARTQEKDIAQDALRAIAASLSMHERLSRLNQRLAEEGKPLIQMGIGIHTGRVVVGSVGGTGRLNYSVLGDTVNIAARLETINKDIARRPYQILISERTWTYIHKHYLSEEIGLFQLRGKTVETKVYAIVGKR